MAIFRQVENSTFLDAYGNGLSTRKQYNKLLKANSVEETQPVLGQLFRANLGTGEVATVKPVPSDSTFTVTVGLVLDRAHEVGSLLSKNWSERQAELKELGPAGIWEKYGADASAYDAVLPQIEELVGSGAFDRATADGYDGSAANRTIWVNLSADDFLALFNTPLLAINDTIPAWYGRLSLPESITDHVKGIWVDYATMVTNPTVLERTPVAPQPLDPDGNLGVGNGSDQRALVTSAAYAKTYDFPDLGSMPTSTIALVEPTSVPSNLYEAVRAYRSEMKLGDITPSQLVVTGPNVSSTPATTGLGELTLDVSVVAGAAPESTQVVYAAKTPFQAYQNAFFDQTNDPSVLSSSWGRNGQPSPDSPFQWAYQQLFIDGLVAGVSTHISGGDVGAGFFSNGVPTALNSMSPLYALVVGGTSVASLAAAQQDATLSGQVQGIVSRTPDLDTLWSLVASGLKASPYHLAKKPPPSGAVVRVFETVWNQFTVTGAPGSQATINFGDTGDDTDSSNLNSSGGVNTGVATPDYQSAFGLPYGGRAVPDVSALAGGDAHYNVLNPAYFTDPTLENLTHGDGGTSAAAPFWASLTARFNAIFQDFGLPQLGFYNDLLYAAAAVAPASFNDITQGNNKSTYFGSISATGYVNGDGVSIAPTGQGYAAGPGFDLVTGLGSPNGVLLGRALLAIANSQTSFAELPDMLVADGTGAWTSGHRQTLILQGFSSDGIDVDVTAGTQVVSFSAGASDSFAWSAQFAQQVMQADFDRRLVCPFDKQTQGMVSQITVDSAEGFAVSIDSAVANALQGSLTSPFGFADFTTVAGDGTTHTTQVTSTVRVARPLAVAETANGQDDQQAIVRLRDNGNANVSVSFYRVDDYEGTISIRNEATGEVEKFRPGDAGYAGAAQARAYETIDHQTAISNPTKGNYAETALLDVDSGDLIAMWLRNEAKNLTFWAFSQANEVVKREHVGHLWSYGLNTWGWEESRGGGDRDYNDLVVQLDFTSNGGSGPLA